MEMLPRDFQLPTNFKVKAAIKKVVEVSYTEDEGIKFNAALKTGPIKATIDENGEVKFKGTLGSYHLKGTPVLDALGAKFKFIEVTFSVAENGDLKYDAKVTAYDSLSFFVGGQFDLEKFVLDRGLLKRAYDPLKNREQQLEDALRESTN